MAVVLLIGAGPLAALMAAEREISGRGPGKSSRTDFASNPSPTAMGEGSYLGVRNVASRAWSAPGSRVSHSQITSADQPALSSAETAASSRCWFRAIFARQ